MKLSRYIQSAPDIMNGQACIAGTRIPVYVILDHLRDGYSIKKIIEEVFPQLSQKQVLAAIEYASLLTKSEDLVNA